MTPQTLTPGKLPPALLAELLSASPPSDSRLLVGPRVGEDAAIIDMGETLLVAKSDPVTFVTDAIGDYAVHVNANDIAVMGGTPRWFLATLLLPERGTTPDQVRDIFAQIRHACKSLNITLAGGHTEITLGLTRPILSGHMLGEVSRDHLVTSAGAQAGDAILLTKGMPLEGIAIMAHERADYLITQGISHDDIESWKQMLVTPGISVVGDAQALQQATDIHAMHDPTEGGVATALHEVAEASCVGVHIWAEHLPILEAGQQLCTIFSLNPIGTIASGALLATLPSDQVQAAITACSLAGIACFHIGTVVANPAERLLISSTSQCPLPTFSRDEIVKIFESVA